MSTLTASIPPIRFPLPRIVLLRIFCIKPEQPDEVHVDDLVVQVAVLVEDDGAVRTRQRMVDDDLAAGRPLLVV